MIHSNIGQAENMQKYAFTLVDNRRDQHDYNLVFKFWEEQGCKIDCKYPEKNKHGYVHYHGIIHIPIITYRKNLVLKGYSAKFDRIYNEEGWINYIKKDQTDESIDTDDNELLAKLKKPLFKIKIINYKDEITK